ncbi:FAD/NAD(P)-binding protein [Streptomyces sp. NPDC051563]|uniref:FAD/NAD(P)-binding protein n=1 Tax=unclassified Streptomyces TaxID=2593676 RepID=UPI0037B32128
MHTEDAAAAGPTRLALVGGGPTCTYVLERLAALVAAGTRGEAGRSRGADLEIVVYDLSGEFGSGEVHSPRQTRTSYLNRIVGQVAFGADESVVDAGPLLARPDRPTFLDWCRDRFATTADPVYDLIAEDWPKRYLHGEALQDRFRRYLEILRSVPGVTVELRHDEVVDLEERGERLALLTRAAGPGAARPDGAPSGGAATVGAATGATPSGEPPYEADFVLLLTGHSTNDPARNPRQADWARFTEQHPATLVPSAYPLERSLDPAVVPPGSTVGCMGMGLTGIDVILYLTEGRGGTFRRADDGRLRYRRCGAEPASVVAFSRSGLFTFSRPYNQKERDIAALEYRGAFLTVQAVTDLRASVGRPVRINGREQRQLDFEAHLFPLVVLEMQLIHQGTLYGPEFRERAVAAAQPAYTKFLADADAFTSHREAVDLLTGPIGELAGRLAATLDRILAGELSLAEARTAAGPDAPPVDTALRRFLTTVHGAGPAEHLLGLVADPEAFAAAVAATPSPWQHHRRAAEHGFSWEATVEPVPRGSYRTDEEYRSALLAFLDQDILWAAQGNLDNPAKAAADGAWRDLRGVVIEAVDFGGLRAGSHRDFLGIYTGHHNRLCQGASCEAMEKVRALIEDGILDVSTGPDTRVVCDPRTGRFGLTGTVTGAARHVDVLVDARVHSFDAAQDIRPIYPNLLRRGLVRKWTNPGVGEPDFVPGGLDLTAEFHPYRADGTVDSRLTVLGPPSEGVMYHQIGALRPHKDHHVLRDILSWTNAFLPSGPASAEPASAGNASTGRGTDPADPTEGNRT